jgi:glycosyltransferase involved in cell wall biosynthesis
VIVHIIWSLDVGGGEVFLSGLSRTIARRGISQRIFTIGPRGRIAGEVESSGIPVTAFDKSSRIGLVTVVRMAAALRRIRPAVVQTHGEGGVFWGVPAATLAGIPVVSLIYQHHESRQKRVAARVGLRVPVTVIAGSRAVADYAHAQLGVPRERLRTIHCGIDPRRFAPVRAQVPASDEWPAIVAVGRLVAFKGHRTLIDAFALVRRRRPHARLTIVGDGPERVALERQVAGAGLAGSVRFAGTVYPTNDVLAHADVFVFPSLHEPQGLALLEAYAAAVPVVASRSGGIPEMLEHEVDGLLVDPGDAPGLAAAIQRLTEDEPLRSACVAHARSRLPAFDVEHVADQYLGVYQSLIPR